jgi:tripartite-type tricarboxylate transporter receptor subunit TctC
MGFHPTDTETGVITRRALLALIALAPAMPAMAQEQKTYPDHLVRIVIGVPPGGVQDLLARSVAEQLTRLWRQTVIVENHPGATGIIAGALVAKAAPDGHTILLSTANNMESAPVLQKNLPFDPVKDFIPVVGLAQVKSVVAINSAVPANNVKELVALARAHPGGLNYGSWGVGSVAHLDALAFAKGVNADFSHIPYKGGNDVIVALASGQIQLAVTTVSTALPLVKQGRIKALAYTGAQRSGLMPTVPTLTELGYSFDRPGGVFSFYLPAGTPKAIVDKLADDTTKVVSSPAFVKDFIDANGMEPYPFRGAQLAEQLDASRKNYLARMKDLDIKIN